jgi:hypothetical protein
MTNERTPAEVRLTAGLGPLPEPAAEAVMDLCADHQGPVEAWQYLPADAMLYTANQMRSYAAAEMVRAVSAERARWTEAVMAELDGNGQAHAIVDYATRA